MNDLFSGANMNVEYVNPFLNATKNVLEMMAFVKPVAGKPFLKKDKTAPKKFAIRKHCRRYNHRSCSGLCALIRILKA